MKEKRSPNPRPQTPDPRPYTLNPKPSPANPSLKILYVCSELSPTVTTGGLGDVANSLPRALRAQGHDVRLALPCYREIPADVRGERVCLVVADLGAKTSHGSLRLSNVPGSDIPLYLVEHDGYFNRESAYGYGAYEFEDNAERFCFFCLSLLHGISQVNWRPDVVHCHDWHTAVIPAYIKTRLSQTRAWRGMPTIFTIHNLGYQGRYKAKYLPVTGLSPDLFTPEYLEFYGDINLMKAGIAFASRLNTVSPRYAEEIQTPKYGEGLDGFLRTRSAQLSGILNGVDYGTWNPETDCYIAQQYSASDLSGKAVCKGMLQRLVGLPERDVPVFGLVSRLYWQKGLDLLVGALEEIARLDLQLVVLGKGDPFYEKALNEAAAKYPGKVRLSLAFDQMMSHQVQAGADFFLMPSHYEPCGLSQLYSLVYGTVPIVRETGGLADSVRHISKANLANETATGIVFQDETPQALLDVIRQATDFYRDHQKMRQVRLTGMKQDFSWDRSSSEYVRLYRQAMAKP